MTDRLIPRDRASHPVLTIPEYRSSVRRAPTQPLLSMGSTPAEEHGPRFGHSLIGPLDNDLILNWTRGDAPARLVVFQRLREGRLRITVVERQRSRPVARRDHEAAARGVSWSGDGDAVFDTQETPSGAGRRYNNVSRRHELG